MKLTDKSTNDSGTWHEGGISGF